MEPNSLSSEAIESVSLSFKVRYNRQQKKCSYVLQHCCKMSWIAMLRVLPPAAFKRLSCNNSGCCRLRTFVAELYFLQQNLYMLRVYRSKANLFCCKWLNSLVWRDSRVILSNQKSVLSRQLATTWFVSRQVWTWVVKREILLFNSFRSSCKPSFFCCSS